MACKIKRLHKEGLPKAEIAGLVGCSRQTVYAYLKDPLRGLGLRCCRGPNHSSLMPAIRPRLRRCSKPVRLTARW
ncbi:helix-turn-helix domain-containing protein [Duodenibacillus massiliensis]|uniref:helix-turn-helix domain-containing protein n=1 Tax=Duodenibacillus massiliensis TaxID=1852381 RepID=UPI003F7E4A2A